MNGENIYLICLLILSIGIFAVQIKIYRNTLVTNVTNSIINKIKNMLDVRDLNEKLVRFLKVYSAFDLDQPIELIRHGRENDGGYVVPVKAFQAADVLLGYGIADDNSFEEGFSQIYNKPSYGFDGGIDSIKSTSPLFTFVNQCISSDRFLYNIKHSSGKISSFSEQIDKLNLKGKKVFIKMDIEGAEYEAFEDILPHYANITGIVLEIHFGNIDSTTKAVQLLSNLVEHFVLVHIHGNNYCVDTGITTSNSIGIIPNVIELTYINKCLVTEYEPSKNQKYPLPIDMPNKNDAPDAQFEILQ